MTQNRIDWTFKRTKCFLSWAKVNWAPSCLKIFKPLTYYIRPLTQEVTLMSQPVLWHAIIHCWAQVIIHSCPQTHTWAETFGILYYFFFCQTNCFKSKPADWHWQQQTVEQKMAIIELIQTILAISCQLGTVTGAQPHRCAATCQSAGTIWV